tara:strand:+ start:3255 stop:3983 length:729 start_codon:yes stop_codon:yes gene_type:complete
MIELKLVDDPAGVRGLKHMVMSAFATQKVWDLASKNAVLPLMNMQQLAYSLIVPRVFQEGRTATGSAFQPAFSTKKTRYWVLPHRPQPPGFVEESKHYKGRKRYESAAHYRRLLGMTRPRLVESGRLARSLKIKALGPRKVRITATGGRPGERRGSSTNAKLLQNLVRGRYKVSVIKPSKREIKELVNLAVEIFTPQLLNQAIAQEQVFNARKRFATRERATKKALRRSKIARGRMQGVGRG